MNDDNLRELILSVIKQVKTEIPTGRKEQAASATAGCSSFTEHGFCQDITAEEYKEKILVPKPKDMGIYKDFKESTPARIGVWRAGDRPMTETILRFRADHALAVDSVFSTVDDNLLDELKMLKLQTMVISKDQQLTRPDLSRDLNEESYRLLKTDCKKKPKLQVIVSDGLSSKAIEANIKDVLPAFIQGLAVNGITASDPVFVKYGRVGVMDVIGEELEAEAAIIFIGERPGLATAESMSAYIVYKPQRGIAEAERTVVSNIHKGGTPPAEAGAHLATIVKRILDEKASGINMKK